MRSLNAQDWSEQYIGPYAQTWWSWRYISSAKAQSASHSQAMLSGLPSLSQSKRRGSLFYVIPV